MVDVFHRHGLQINTWTCDDPRRMRELIEWQVDGICTNVPDLALQVVNATH
jgi:glycerophosphoryl diester phosphodiesterase